MGTESPPRLCASMTAGGPSTPEADMDDQLSRTSLDVETAESGLRSPLLPNAGADHDDSDADSAAVVENDHMNNDDASTVAWERRRRRLFRRLLRKLRKFGDYLAYATLLTMLLVIPVVLLRALSNRELDKAAFNSAKVMVMGTVVLSCRLVYLHLTHWYMPEVQKYVVRILWMVPIYAVQSYLSLRYHESRIYIDCLRDLYEAYVIASFVYYLIALLGGQDALVQILQHKEESARLGQHSFPLNLILTPWDRGVEFMLQCKHGVLQYVLFKILAVAITFVCESADVFGEGKFSWTVAYPYLCFMQNISVMYALYCLVMLYHAVQEELRHPVNWRPLGKFLCVKGVVFFTWWQGVLIFYLRAHGIIEHMGTWSSQEVANGLIDYCIVVEMIGFSIAHSFTFSYKEYLPSSLPVAGVIPTADGDGDGANNNNNYHDNHHHGNRNDTASHGRHSDFSISRTRRTSASQSNPTAAAAATTSTTVQTSASRQCPATTTTTTLPTTAINTPNRPLERADSSGSAYHRPPAVLDEPMPFRDAFWSSTVPRETIRDIRHLRRTTVARRRTGTSESISENGDDDVENVVEGAPPESPTQQPQVPAASSTSGSSGDDENNADAPGS